MLSRGKDRVSAVCPHTRRRRPVTARLRWALWAFPVFGAVSLVWFLIRVIPKPSRAAYPCQRVAVPLASSFLVWLAGTVGAMVALHKTRDFLSRARVVLAAATLSVCLVAGGLALWHTPTGSAGAGTFTPSDPPNQPMGSAGGLHPGRVVWVHDPNATNWNGSTGYWWEDANLDQTVVDEMMGKTIRWLAGATTDEAAWDAIFRHFNITHHGQDSGYAPGEKIAIKINMNSDGTSNVADNSPQGTRALLRQLVYHAGVPAAAITVYDASRDIGDPTFQRCHEEFPEVTFVTCDGGNGRVAAVYDPQTPIYHSDSALATKLSFVPTCVTQSKYLINFAVLKPHTMASVTLTAKNHLGSVYREGTGGWSPSYMHAFINPQSVDSFPARPYGTYTPLVDLIGHAQLSGKTVLYLIDALYGSRGNQNSIPTRWRSGPFNDYWPSSLFASQDPVALDSVGVDFLQAEDAVYPIAEFLGDLDNYLHEAALADDPPSGTFYDSNHDGDVQRMASLGVHEHWNNAADKQYSRNLGTGDGIELIHSEPVPIPPKVVAVRLNGRQNLGVSSIEPTITGVASIELRFSKAVNCTETDVAIREVNFVDDVETLGPSVPLESIDGSGTETIIIRLGGAVGNTWVKVTLDGVTDLDGLSLDGEATGSGRGYLYDSYDLPSGDGIAGGAAIFYVGALTGDMNQDGSVDIFDFVVMQTYFGTAAGATAEQGDLNDNGTVDIIDFAIFQPNYQQYLTPLPE